VSLGGICSDRRFEVAANSDREPLELDSVGPARIEHVDHGACAVGRTGLAAGERAACNQSGPQLICGVSVLASGL
jgi:hypothetical protein